MKCIGGILLALLFLFLPGCTPNAAPADPAPPDEILNLPQVLEMKTETRQAVITPLDVAGILSLSPTQGYDVCDYTGNKLLLLVHDTAKVDSRDINDQVMAMYYNEFVLIDLSDHSVIASYPLEEFGFCHSALFAYDGVLFSYITRQGEPETIDPAIYYLNGAGRQRVYDGDFGHFNIGPILQHHDGEVLFSHENLSDSAFGLQQIGPNLQVSPLLSFRKENVEFISEDFVATQTHYAYPVAEEDLITFYLGTGDQVLHKIRLAQGESIYAYTLTEDSLVVCKEAIIAGGTYRYLERFDFSGNSLELYKQEIPFYLMDTNGKSYICGFENSPVELYEAGDELIKLNVDTSMIDSNFNSARSNGEDFLIIGYLDTPFPIWTLSLEE